MVRGQKKSASHEDAEETRRTILRVAQELFMEHGYRAISTRQLADACGLTQPALYHYFRDKQELYMAMALEEINKMKAALERIARRNEGVEERLHRTVLYLLHSTQHDLGLMLHDIRYELSEDTQFALNKAFQEGIVRPIALIFEEGLQQKLLRSQQYGGVDPITSTYLFLSMISRFLARERNTIDSKTGRNDSDEELASLLVRILLHGLAYPNVEGSK